MYYRLSKHSFVRKIENFGYIYNQRTKVNITFTDSGSIFLLALARLAQPLDSLVSQIASKFEGVSESEIYHDVEDFYNELLEQKLIVAGVSEQECNQKDYDERLSDLSELQSDDFEDYIKDPYLQSCQIEITNKCNERCIHCYIPHNKKNIELPYNAIENLLFQLRQMGTLKITLSGGEFFLHPDCIRILRKVRELDFSYRILSNVTMLNKNILEVLKETIPRIIQISLYSMDANEHDSITHLAGSFEKTIQAIEILKENGIPIELSCPVMELNYKSYKNVLSYAKSINCSAHTDLMLLSSYDFAKENVAERLSLNQIENLLQEIAKYESTPTPIQDEKKSKEEWMKEPLCLVGQKEICVDANGNVFPCAGGQAIVCGNIMEQPMEDIWLKSPTLNNLRLLKKSSIPQCYDCKANNICHVCLVYNYNESAGDYFKVPKRFCEISRLKMNV
ncbi:MAG: radical SAM protein [Fibrobacter sp.]|nr:radical SAM protein [Fibrobacter sp.]